MALAIFMRAFRNTSPSKGVSDPFLFTSVHTTLVCNNDAILFFFKRTENRVRFVQFRHKNETFEIKLIASRVRKGKRKSRAYVQNCEQNEHTSRYLDIQSVCRPVSRKFPQSLSVPRTGPRRLPTVAKGKTKIVERTRGRVGGGAKRTAYRRMFCPIVSECREERQISRNRRTNGRTCAKKRRPRRRCSVRTSRWDKCFASRSIDCGNTG